MCYVVKEEADVTYLLTYNKFLLKKVIKKFP